MQSRYENIEDGLMLIDGIQCIKKNNHVLKPSSNYNGNTISWSNNLKASRTRFTWTNYKHSSTSNNKMNSISTQQVFLSCKNTILTCNKQHDLEQLIKIQECPLLNRSVLSDGYYMNIQNTIQDINIYKSSNDYIEQMGMGMGIIVNSCDQSSIWTWPFHKQNLKYCLNQIICIDQEAEIDISELKNDLLGFVAHTTSLVGSGGMSDPDNRRKLTVLPAPDPLHKSHHIGLLLPP